MCCFVLLFLCVCLLNVRSVKKKNLDKGKDNCIKRGSIYCHILILAHP